MKEDRNTDFGAGDIIWDLTHLYNSMDNKKVKEDMQKCRKEALSIRNKYAGHVSELKADNLTKLVSDLEKVAVTLGRLSSFAYLNFATHVSDPEKGAFLQKFTEFSSEVEKELVFFDIEWAEVPEERSKTILAGDSLKHYRHYLESVRRYRAHMLSHAEEQLLIERSPVGVSSWKKLFSKVLAKIHYGKNARTQEEVLSDLYSNDRDTRKSAACDITEGLKTEIHVLTHIFNTVLADKMIDDRLRKYPLWVSSMNLSNELDDKTVDALIQAVTSRYDIVSRYYDCKRVLMEYDELFDYDRYAPLPFAAEKKVHWEECRKIVHEAFEKFSPEMASIADRFFKESWIHAPVREGKKSGAFAHPSVPDVHPYILVNYTGNMRDVETVAHELGHGVHQVLASKSGYFNSHTPLTLAETASVFAEMLVFKNLLGILEEKKEKISLLSSKIDMIFATVFRQVAMNRFENAIHTLRRDKGELSEEDFSKIWLETQANVFGKSVTMTTDYSFWWSYIGHFVSVPGYVYAYAFGELLVLSLYAMYEKGEIDFVSKYLSLLSAGGSESPYVLLKPFGIDLHDKDFWHKGLDYIDAMVSQVEELKKSI